ncbi:methyltransferase family protein [Teredinibacter turnerae]|uniref:methyltransferase family protein n=1 Tax=Teredinibacter turnerae TaxID=2426 RepID=UPI00037FD508|nr:isoprenylcysteine carboxylmethyltransferase family protein [Teredinibacter turnerae]
MNTQTSTAGIRQTKSGAWITDKAWICGVVGAITVLLCAMAYNRFDILNKGLFVFGQQLTSNRTDSILAALFIITAAMLITEMVRLWLWDRDGFISIDPDLRARNLGVFFTKSLLNYLLYLAALWVVLEFYHTANEYGFRMNANYYQGWFRFTEMVWSAYLWAGLPYVLITRAVRYDPKADSRDTGWFLGKLLRYPLGKVSGSPQLCPQFGPDDAKIARALIVKLFFTPLMTVFFIGQFPHLVSNVGYLFGSLPASIANGTYTHRVFNSDFFNISIAFIFSIDVALAWCGYVISSRWVDNQTASAEPTMLGWVVCLICYPPFQQALGWYYSAPGERDVLRFDNQWIITVFTGMMVCSYIVYMSATLWFGVRFSNLTNRGIIRKGPFAFVRHPAYASKNFAWWCVMFPAILYNATHTGIELAAMQTFGLCLMTFVYYQRALTEERHLRLDPVYLEYCEQVKYRFIPRVL